MRRLAALLLLLALLLGGCAAAPEAPAAPEGETAFPRQPEAPQRRSRDELPAVRVYFDGLLADRGYLVDGTLFLACDALCAAHELPLDGEADEARFSLSLPGISVSGQTGEEIFRADSRYLYEPEGWLTADRRICLPCDAVEKLFNVRVTLSGDGTRADVDTTGFRLMEGGADYYEKHYSVDDLYWLSHIIHAESWQQPLAGQIGVGNVVLNRVRHKDFPNSIMDVVLDREHAVQFEPVLTGGVRERPDEQSLIAAYLCLEGYNTVGDSLFFVNPDKGSSYWFDTDRDFVVKIGDHQFYA